MAVTCGLFLHQESRLQLNVHAPSCDPPCHLIVNMHPGTALALPDSAPSVQVIALSQGLFLTGSIHEVVQVFRKNYPAAWYLSSE